MPLKHNIDKLKNMIKNEGAVTTLKKLSVRLKAKISSNKPNVNESNRLQDIYKILAQNYQAGEIKGIAIIPSAFEFDELYNQRTINLAKYMANHGYGVLYIAWQWYAGEALAKSGQEVYSNVYQLSLYNFLYHEASLDLFSSWKEKFFVCTFPAKEFYNLLVRLRTNKFNIIYDIMDEWEEFFKAGQASWYKREIEEKIVAAADFVSAVSEPLKRKYSHLNKDIAVIGNGYFPEVSKEKGISCREKASDGRIHLGYVGHLTDSWFNWQLIFDMLAAREDIYIHLIGYGVSQENLNILEKFPNAHFYGKINPSELHNYVRNWHIGLIPFKQSVLSEAVDPIKIYEYLYFGLPTISTGIPHIGEYPLVKHCNNLQEVVNNIDIFYEKIINNNFDKKEIEVFLAETTWDKRFETMLMGAEKTFKDDN